MNILFVCLGNICRSPMAEGILKKLCSDNSLNWKIESAGTNGYHVGEAPHKSSQKVCNEKGINISTQRARRFSKKDFEDFDKIYVLAKDVYNEVKRVAINTIQMEKVELLLNEVYPSENRDVTDPWYGNEEGYYPVFEEIEKACVAILKKYKQ